MKIKKPKKIVIEFREPIKGWREPKTKLGLMALQEEIKMIKKKVKKVS